ncbi:conserved hypothetical protein [Paraburkholderia piptadeniae]|uniref:Uncharacterized protein n=1 Tax=Paraburkholderia piptadeniae TaxID=1701573 RepID=A0A1N7SFX7_9BURK|nr:LamG domain-containing protein [Paraburkholderia piptadeniae]SIT46287.1 conserved hypothetical protein [Paraburkholderia piptadeniae]
MAMPRRPYEQVILADAPFAYWRLNETSGTVAADLSGNGRNGTYQPGVLLACGPLVPSTKLAYVGLTGTANSYVDVSAANQFCAGNAWSIECWANIATYTNAGSNGAYPGCTGARFIGNTTWTGGSTRKPGLDWGIMALNSNSVINAPQLWARDYQNANAPVNSAPQPGQAAHYVLAASNAGSYFNYSMYLNGALLATAGIQAVTIQAVLQIGSIGWTEGPLNGAIGEVALTVTRLRPSRCSVTGSRVPHDFPYETPCVADR